MAIGGVTSAGFVLPTLEEIQADLNTKILATVDPGLDLSPNTPMGQIVTIFAEKLAEVWELGQVAYNAFNPDAAESFLLDALSALTGTLRLAADASMVTCVVNLNAGATLPQGSVANVVGHPEITFASVVSVTNSATGATGVPCVFACQVNGPVVANAGTLTVITAPVAGWNSVTNALDATLGRLEERDTPLRIRRRAELAASGASTVDAIRADVLEVPGVISVFVFENVSEVTDAEGIPPHNIQVIVYDGASPAATDADIAAAIWASKPSGAGTYGTTEQDTADSEGTTRQVYFSRATPENVYMEVDVSINPLTFPIDGDTQIKAAIVAEGVDNLLLGSDVIALRYRALPLSVAGVLDVPALRLGLTASPTGTSNIVVDALHLAVLDTSRILVTHV